jgi:hypothetical protein
MITTKYITSYLVLPIKECDNEKMVCNPTRQTGSPTQHGSHIYMQVGCWIRRVLASSFSSSIIGGRFGGGWTQRLKERNGEDSFLSYEKRRIYGSNVSGPSIQWKNLHISCFCKKKKTCKCQITQYSYVRNIITHTLVRTIVISTSDHARMSWLSDVNLFMVVTSWNKKIRRNRSIGTTSIRVPISIIRYVNNNF